MLIITNFTLVDLEKMAMDKMRGKKYTTINENVLAKLKVKVDNVLVNLKESERTLS